MRYILFLCMMVFSCADCAAQTQLKISVGERGQQYEVTQQPVKQTISASVIKDDPKLHLVSKDDNYIVGQYDVSVAKDKENVVGPFTVKDGNEREVFDKLYSYFEPGVQIFYDKIIIVRRNPPATIAHPGISVELQ